MWCALARLLDTRVLSRADLATGRLYLRLLSVEKMELGTTVLSVARVRPVRAIRHHSHDRELYAQITSSIAPTAETFARTLAILVTNQMASGAVVLLATRSPWSEVHVRLSPVLLRA